MNKLKIAILSYRSAPFSGGQGIFVYELSKAIKDLGHQVDVISGPPYPKLADNIKLIKTPGLNLFESFSLKDRWKKFTSKKGKKFDDYYEFFVALFGGFPEMRTFGNRAQKIINSSDYDVLFDNQSISYGILKLQNLIPLIEVIHHPITRDKHYEIFYAKKFSQKILIRSWYSFLRMQKKVAIKLNTVVTPSSNSKKDIMNDFKVSGERIHVIHNGIDTISFTPKPHLRQYSQRIITTASADVPLKGLDFTLKAVSKLKHEFNDIKLIIIGNPRSGGHTERLIQQLEIFDRVSFKTNLTKDEIAAEYARSQIAVVSSLYEGFGFPVGEAMACSVPLIATDIASIPEITDRYAELVNAEDADQIADAIKKILGNYETYFERAKLGREHILKNFNWKNIALEYIDLANELTYPKC